MIIIADENIPRAIEDLLTTNGFQVISIRKTLGGAEDIEIIRFAQQKPNALILTEDKDFGEWVFAHHLKNITIVFLRYHFSETERIGEILSHLLQHKSVELFNKFTTVTTKKIRIREI